MSSVGVPLPREPELIMHTPVMTDPSAQDFCNLLEQSLARSGALAATTTFHPHLALGSPLLLGVAGAQFASVAMIQAATTHLETFARRYGAPAAASLFRYAPQHGATYHIRCRVLAAEEQGCLVRSALFDSHAAAEHAARLDKTGSDSAPAAFFRLWLRCRALEAQADDLATALDSCGYAIYILDEQRALRFANRQARTLLEFGDGIRCAGSSIAATSRAEATHLQVALHEIVGAGNDRELAPVVMNLPRRSGRPLAATLVQLVANGQLRGMVLHVVDPDLDIAPLLQRVCGLFRLSPVEERLTVLLATGVALVDAAKSMRVKELTARSYLKQIFLKTETRRQADLVRLLMSTIIRTTVAHQDIAAVAATFVSETPLHSSLPHPHSRGPNVESTGRWERAAGIT